MSEAASLRHLPAPVIMAQRPVEKRHWLDPVEQAVTFLPEKINRQRARVHLDAMCDAVLAADDQFRALSAAALATETAQVRDALRRARFGDDEVVQAMALVREISARELGMRHYRCQVLGALTLINGRLAEMDTGEGKTLTGSLAAAVAALAGVPTHVVTVNDYLAARDADLMMPVYNSLGLRVGVIQADLETPERQAAYAADITYCTNSEVAFDHLRDRLAIGRGVSPLRMKVDRLTGRGNIAEGVVQRGLFFAIVDEADSVLIDEARTPLIIATETRPEEERSWAEAAFELADSLEPNAHYRIRMDRREVTITERGKKHLKALGEARGGLWAGKIRREESVRQALSARFLFQRGDHYVVRDDKVMIVDEYSGRIMEDRSWNEGMHQLVEVKEGVEVTGRKRPAVKTSYQKFFRKYQRLAGMTGTGREVVEELRSVYRLKVTRIPPNKPSRRRRRPTRILRTLEAKREAIAVRAAELVAEGRAVLIGTRSIAASQALSGVLTAHGLDHQVLNAEHEAEEAEIIACAGQSGRITVATNMAGRGVDIDLDPAVRTAGGLYVILSEMHDAGRIDRQLAGRAGRQGDPGDVEYILSLDDPILTAVDSASRSFRLLRHSIWLGRPERAFNAAQRRAERAHSRLRRDLLNIDDQMSSMLSLVGDEE